MSTIKVTNVSHPSAASPAIVLDADGDATYAGVHDFSAATVTGAPQGLVHINTTTFSAVSSVSLNDVFTSDYQNYEIVLPFESSSTGADMTLRLRAGGTDSTATNYYIQQLYILANNSPSGVYGNNAQYVFSGSGTTKYAGRITLYRPNEAVYTFANSFFWNQAPSLMFRGMEHQLATAYDGLTIYPSTGTITGTIRVYGYSNGA